MRSTILSVAVALSVALSPARSSADCWTDAANSAAPLDLALVVAGLNHLHYPDTDVEAPPWKSVEAPIENAAQAIKERYTGKRLVAAITGNKVTDFFNDLETRPADRLEHLLQRKGVPIGGSIGEGQFRLIHGPGWRVYHQRFVSYPPDRRMSGFDGFFVVKLEPMFDGGAKDWATPDLHVYIVRPPPHDENAAIRGSQFSFVTSVVKAEPTNHRVALPFVVGDLNTNYPSKAEAQAFAADFDWLTWQMPCRGNGFKVFGDAAGSSLMNILVQKGAASRSYFKPAFIGYSTRRDGTPENAIWARHLAHELSMVGFQKKFDASFCAPGMKVCDDQSCRRSCPSTERTCPARMKDCGDGVCVRQVQRCPGEGRRGE